MTERRGGGILKINRRGGANKLRGGARKSGKLIHGGARLFDTLEYPPALLSKINNHTGMLTRHTRVYIKLKSARRNNSKKSQKFFI